MSGKPTILLFGHGGYYNRGCEAIVDSTVHLLREARPDFQFILHSFDSAGDKQRSNPIVTDIRPGYAPKYSGHGLIGRLLNRINPRWTHWWMTEPIRKSINSSDLVLSIGGDNYCYEDSPYFYYVDRLVRKSGKPIILWGATVQMDRPSPEKQADLSAFSAITARERLTVDVLARHGIINNVYLVSDPAFALKPRAVSVEDFWPKRPHVLGLNLSPLVGRYAASGLEAVFGSGMALVRYAISNPNVGVILIPHVTDPMPAREKWNDDATILSRIIKEIARPDCVTIMPSWFSASEIKHVISKCDWFIGARTHSTIAALSSKIPTLTIAYSSKAHGINKEIFNDDRWVIDITDLKPDVFCGRFDSLTENAVGIRQSLQTIMPKVITDSRLGVQVVLDHLERKSQDLLERSVTTINHQG